MERQNAFKHEFTWLKVLVVAFLADTWLLGLKTHNIAAAFTEGWPITLLMVIAGLVIGFLFNAFSNFRRPVLLYSIGHMLVLLFVFLYFKWTREQAQSDNPHQEITTLHIGDPYDEYRQRLAVAAFNSKYARDSFRITTTDIFPADSNNNHLWACYILFEENATGRQLLNRYQIEDSTIHMVCHNQPVPGRAYEDYLKSSPYRKLVQDITDSVQQIIHR